ncbi:MAG TPA: ribulose-phosphate 3-epimerase [Aggregatilineales bacterium]|nr:ribulose-phosphate 3-epimerase [Aggregatilineales bacterium]
MPVKIAPSLLAADFTRLAEDIQAVADSGADMLHLDVMDGRFVPNLTFGMPIVAAARRLTTLPLDTHLMIVEPERYIGAFVRAGATMLTVHVEACPHLHRVIQEIKEAGIQVGVALNPHTPFEMIREALPDVDRILVMTVNPGFGGQRFIPTMLTKINQIWRAVQPMQMEGRHIEIAVDGGIDPLTAGQVVRAGADVLIAGHAIFGASEGIVAGVRALRAAAE